MRARTLLLLGFGACLAACGGGREQLAAQACSAEIAKRLGTKTYAIDQRDLAAHAKTESADTLLLSSTAVFDKGLSTEYKQSYDCRVRFDSANAASVLYLDFKWNTADLKKAE
jgi:hypothetical protein